MNSDDTLGALATMLTTTAMNVTSSDEQLKEDDMNTIFNTKNTLHKSERSGFVVSAATSVGSFLNY